MKTTMVMGALAGLTACASICGVGGCSSDAHEGTATSTAAITLKDGSGPQWNGAWNSIDIASGMPEGAKPYDLTPSVAVTPRGLEMFYMGTDGAVYHRIGDASGTQWGSPESIGSGFDPAQVVGVAATPHQMVVAAIQSGSRSILTHTYAFGSGQWQDDWIDTGGHSQNQGVAVAAGLWHFYLAAVGMEGHLWYDYAYLPGVAGGWFGWTDIGGTCDLMITPAAASWGDDRLDVLVARVGDQEAFHTFVQDEQPGGWEDLQATMDGGAVSSWGNEEYDFFVRTPGGVLQQRTWNGGWGGWQTVLPCDGGWPPRAAAANYVSGHIDLFTTGTDGSLWHTFYGVGASSGGQQPYCCGLDGSTCCPSNVTSMACFDALNDACDPVSNQCEPCGRADGETCCHYDGLNGCSLDLGLPNATEICNPGTNRCESYSNCGEAGHECCIGNTCKDGSTCSRIGYGGPLGTCKPKVPLTCSGQVASGAQLRYVDIRMPDHCAANPAVAAYYANSEAEAIGCGLRDYPGDGVTQGQATDAPSPFEYHYLADGNCETADLEAFNVSDATTCALAYSGVLGGCTCSQVGSYCASDAQCCSGQCGNDGTCYY
jgi:hypothetical protein